MFREVELLVRAVFRVDSTSFAEGTEDAFWNTSVISATTDPLLYGTRKWAGIISEVH